MKPDSRQQPTRRLHIERLELDLRGVTPGTAEAAVRLLGPALGQALAGRQINTTPSERIDAGRIGLAGAVDAATLAGQLARRIADKTSGG